MYSGKVKSLTVTTLLLVSLAGAVVGCGTATPSAPTPTPPDSNLTEVASSNIDKALTTLTTYFSALQAGQYDEAAQLYGGTYETLWDWNPTVARDDHGALFKGGCEQNGLQCLEIKDVVKEEEISPGEYRFIVEFKNKDGTLFKQGPCCGATELEMPTKTQFEYMVKEVDNRYLVTGLPVYTP